MALTDLEIPAAESVSPLKLALARRSRLPVMGVTPMTFTGDGGYALPAVNLQTVLSRPNGALPPAPTQSGPTQLFASTKSAPIQQQIGTATQQRATNQGQAQQSVSDFVKEFLASKGQSQQAANEESAAIAGIYGSGPNSVQSQLARLNAQRTAAINQGAQSAMARAIRANNIRRMQSGNSSYLDRLLAQDLAGIGATAAGQAADQGRADLQYLTGLRTGNVGRQQEIIDRILSRNLMPVQATADVEALNLRNLASLSNLDQSNTVYERPEDAYLNRANFYDLLRRRALY